MHHRSPAHTFGPPKKRAIGALTFVGVGVIDKAPPAAVSEAALKAAKSTSPIDDTLISNGVLEEMPAIQRRRSSSAFGHVMESVNRVKTTSPKVTLKFRNKGTELWPKVEPTPGPGSYDESKFSYVLKKTPKFTVPHSQLTSLKANFNNLGPFAI